MLQGNASLRINLTSHIWSFFLNTLFFCFVPKYLGIPVLTKYFATIWLFLSWGRPPFLLFYPNFRPFLHPKYIKNLIKAFLQNCRYGKYLSFATLHTTVTELGLSNLYFPATFFFFQTSFEEVLSMSRNQNWYLLRQNKSKSIWQISNTLDLQHVHMFKFNPQLRVGHMYHGIKYKHVNMLKIQSVWNLSDV